MTNQEINDNTPIAALTVGQFNKVCGNSKPVLVDTPILGKVYEYGVSGIERIFHCSPATANRIKQSGKIDKAITQIGKKIIIDVNLALELAGAKSGGRK